MVRFGNSRGLDFYRVRLGKTRVPGGSGGKLPLYCDRFAAKIEKMAVERDLRFNIDENSVSFMTARDGCFPVL
jgi:hypothetical protein